MLPRTNILKISPYIGGDITPPGMHRRIVLASNESPLGPSPLVLEHLKKDPISLSSYPSGGAHKLRQAIAQVHQLNVDQIICGNGSEEVIHMLAQTFTEKGDEVVSPQYGFMVYRIATLAANATPVFYTQKNLDHQVDEILNVVTPHTKLVILDNPANPLGCIMGKDEMLRLRKELPEHIFLVIDDAYSEFVEDPTYESGLTLFKDHRNVMVLRTFSKAYGLAGLRIGFGHTANHEILDAMNRMRAPFNVNAMGQELASVAVHDQSWVKKLKNHNTAWINYTRDNIKQLGFEIPPSYGNFVLFHTGSEENAQKIYRYLGEQGIMTRPVTGYGLKAHLRVSIGKGDEMEEFISLLQKVAQTL